jgi:hypothetical protein
LSATLPATEGKQSTARIKQQQDYRDTNRSKSMAIAEFTAVTKTTQRSETSANQSGCSKWWARARKLLLYGRMLIFLGRK